MAEARSAEPTEEQISSLCEIAGFARPEAISRLKANGLDADRAIDEWLNNPDSSQYRWDESAWSADRDGDTNSAGIGFHIQGPDVTASYHNSAAPTRPPSRTNNRSPLGAPATAAEADADLQRAMAMSRAEAGLPPQESGIVDNNVTEKSFGPATRAEYEKDQWAMVPIKADTAREASQLAPSARKRASPAPAFLRTTKDHRLGAIITILHSIPKARNILLSCGPPSRTYGHNSEWWNGQPILSPEALEMLARDEWAPAPKPEFYDELHRLLAFLDNTERAYGTIDGLAQTDVIDPAYSWSGPDFEDQFFSFLKGRYEEDLRLNMKPFISTAKTARVIRGAKISHPQGQPGDAIGDAADDAVRSSADGIADDADMEDSDSSSDNYQEFPFMDINLEDGQNVWVKSLYDALDSIFWNQALTEKMDDPYPGDDCRLAYLTEVGEILTIRINGEGLCQPCDIPGVLYMDRYMEGRKDLAMAWQVNIHSMRSVLGMSTNKGVKNLKTWEDSVTYCRGKTHCRELGWYDGKQHLALDCYERFIKACEFQINMQRRRAQKRHTEERILRGEIPTIAEIAGIYSGNSPYELTEDEKVLEENLESDIEVAKRSSNEIEDQLDRIDMNRQKANIVLDHVSKWLTCRKEEAPSQQFVDDYIQPTNPKYYKPHYWNPTHRYHLRGVATTKEITYVCTRREPVLIELEDQSEPRDQWWRLVYSPQETSPLSVEKTDLDTVTMLAGTESKNPILVYAAEEALDATPVQLSDALRMFVRADNRSFQNELAREQTEAEERIENQAAQANPEATLGDGPVPLTVDAIQAIASDELNMGSKRKYSIAASSVATIDSTDSRDLDMSFSDVPDRFSEQDGAPRPYHREFVSPAARSNSLGGLEYKPGEPFVPGHLQQPNPHDGQQVQMPGTGDSSPKAPEMQERVATGPSPFVAQRPVSRASLAAPIDLMDIDVEHVEHRED